MEPLLAHAHVYDAAVIKRTEHRHLVNHGHMCCFKVVQKLTAGAIIKLLFISGESSHIVQERQIVLKYIYCLMVQAELINFIFHVRKKIHARNSSSEQLFYE